MKNLAVIKNIIVVDDEDIIVDSIQTGLELKGYNVIGFDSAEKTIEYLNGLKSDYPDLIITDYKLARKSGLDLLSEIKNKFGVKIRIIIMTGYGDKSLVIESFRYGADDFIDKPVTMKNILSSISRVEKKLNS